MQTVENQNIMTIHKEAVKSDFLQIKNENWHNMLIHTKDTYAFVLYIYFASNANNYSFALSPKAIEEATGLPRSTFYKKLNLLIDKGYIIEGKSNRLHFYEVTQKQEEKERLCAYLSQRQSNSQQREENLPQNTSNLLQTSNCSCQNIEIDNIYITDKEQIKHTLELLQSEESTDQKPKEFIF